MKIIISIFLAGFVSLSAFAQSDIQKLVSTERAFAQLAAEKGTKHAFLVNMTDDGVLFQPEKINGKEFWKSSPESASLLLWAPNYADISSNGILGYTTGNWEFRLKGKDDQPVAFGEFITLWLRQPDGTFKFVVDIGVSHDRPLKYSTDVAYATVPGDKNEKNSSAADVANGFFELAVKDGRRAAYQAYAADDVRMFRENKMPVIGKKNMLSEIKKVKGRMAFAKRSVFFGASDIAYIANTYTFTNEDKTIEKGNFVQIWKHMQGRWQIVLDIFKPVPEK
jgi:ketosteroid isomerase-like protein